MEVLCSTILGYTNFKNYVQYTGRYRNTSIGRLYVDKCKSFIIDEEYYFVEAWEVIEYCKTHNINYKKFMLNKFGADFANIPIIDYLLINTDRHTQNYGVMCNSKGQIVKIAPLFDFNCGLVADYYAKFADDTLSQMLNSKDTIFDLAFKYKKYADVKLDNEGLDKLKQKKPEYKRIIYNILNRYKMLYH